MTLENVLEKMVNAVNDYDQTLHYITEDFELAEEVIFETYIEKNFKNKNRLVRLYNEVK